MIDERGVRPWQLLSVPAAPPVASRAVSMAAPLDPDQSSPLFYAAPSVSLFLSLFQPLGRSCWSTGTHQQYSSTATVLLVGANGAASHRDAFTRTSGRTTRAYRSVRGLVNGHVRLGFFRAAARARPSCMCGGRDEGTQTRL
jgi:hypothetical protein